MRFLRWCGNAWWRCTENGCRCGRPGGRGSRGRRRAGRGSTDDGRRRPAVAEHRFYSCEERVRVLDLECMATASSLVAVPGGGGDGLIPGRRAGGRWRWHSNSSSPSSTQPPSPMSRLPSVLNLY
ncbi:uncharacterized protein [Triticum aestivum]|uniref:uncharacterized protein isoform X2 n=1 Tax=Triticum aestivum TaxID=4565 RepID=UPI001D024DE7|nr:uncharacterized protein LOC123054544 isoform X2 [Triticum aestivum]